MKNKFFLKKIVFFAVCFACVIGSVLYFSLNKTTVFQKKSSYLLDYATAAVDPAKAFPGNMGTCSFDSEWEYSEYVDPSGQKFTFYKANVSGAKLPDCSTGSKSDALVVFKGWKNGFTVGDKINIKETCTDGLSSPGTPSVNGQSYAPCYELVPHVRLSLSAGALAEGSGFEFNERDMTYIAKGSSVDDTIALPNVEYSGYSSSTELTAWKNQATGEVKNPGDTVKYDGSIWMAVTSVTSIQTDIYKIVDINKASNLFVVEGMIGCSLSSGDHVTVSFSGSEQCEVKGLKVTDPGVYDDVQVDLLDGSTRIYKFAVEDRTTISQDSTSGIIDVVIDESQFLEPESSTSSDDFIAGQCQEFFIARDTIAHPRVIFARGELGSYDKDMYARAFTVYKMNCPKDNTEYVALCIDPGRRGPTESGAGGTYEKVKLPSGGEKKVFGNKYKKTQDIQKDSEMGKVASYIAKNLKIEDFALETNEAKINRTAANVAARIVAINEGFSMKPDLANIAYTSYFYPYLGIANEYKTKRETITAMENEDDRKNAVKNILKSNSYTCSIEVGHSVYNVPCYFAWNGDSISQGVLNKTAEVLANYRIVEEVSESSTFEKTIKETMTNKAGDGYTVKYTGTISAPSGTTATMEGFNYTSKPDEEGRIVNVKGDVIRFEELSPGHPDLDGMEVPDDVKVYGYEVLITVDDASAVHPPQTDEDKKDVSFKIDYTGGHSLLNMFIAEPANGSHNVQRMLMISTKNPTIYLYLDIAPSGICELDLDCIEEDDEGDFNEDLFTSAGCCRYITDETSEIFQNYCVSDCTSSTLSTVCDYNKVGNGYADLYEIKEGTKFESGSLVNNIGKCVANVKSAYANEKAEPMNNGTIFSKTDDKGNSRNVNNYSTNMYCQVTCKEDWQLSMDSFGNFIGESAVAAGSYFSILNNDIFIGAKRSCYTTFINYDRYMANLVDLSVKLVENYNKYTEWSKTWTDINDKKSSNDTSTFTDSNAAGGIVCAEYYDKCPDEYFWDDGANKCLQVVNYDGSGPAKCESKPCPLGKSCNDSVPVYDQNENNADTKCKFDRYSCTIAQGTIDPSTNKCKLKETVTRDWVAATDTDGNYIGDYCDTSQYYKVGLRCYSKTCPSGYSYESMTKCSKTTISDSTHELVNVKPDYAEKDLKCRVWGKGYTYTLKTSNLSFDKYNTTESSEVELAGKNDGTGEGCKNCTEDTQTSAVKNFTKIYTHKCKVIAAEKKPGAQGSSKCEPTGLTGTDVDVEGYSVSETITMFCQSGKYANLTGTSLDKSFCYAGGDVDGAYDNNTNATKDTSDYSEKDESFKFVARKMMEHSQKETESSRNEMSNLHSNIYQHSQDMFDCQNFQLHNRTDDTITGAKNNVVMKGSILGLQRDFVKINTDYNPIGKYIYDEKYFMERIGEDDNVIIRYDEKNDGIYDKAGLTSKISGFVPSGTPIAGTTYSDCKNSYDESQNCRVKDTIDITTDSGHESKEIYLDRNYIEMNYFNPDKKWGSDTSDEDNMQSEKDYSDSTKTTNTVDNGNKKIVLCSVGNFSGGNYNVCDGTTYCLFKDVDVENPKWVGGACYEVEVDYKKAHYIESSISNSSYYKNKGYWYVSGGDSKIHGDNAEDAANKFNTIQPTGYEKNIDPTTMRGNWSKLGEYNVFPVSMATPRNLYQYTYSFMDIGSYDDGSLGRIMGDKEKSIIQNNVRSCFYEVMEEICYCCGYTIEPGQFVFDSFDPSDPEYVAPTPSLGSSSFDYDLSDTDKMMDSTNGSVAFYTSSVSLGDIDLGRESSMDEDSGSHWSKYATFMFNGSDDIPTDKGFKLKENIEKRAENAYSDEPEYAYFLTPDTLKQIRSYNDANSYAYNLDNLQTYGARNMDTSDGISLSDSTTETINFQHYGSKFLNSGDIDLKPYGFIDNTFGYFDNCLVKDVNYDSDYNIANFMRTSKCRWVDFVETKKITGGENMYYNPVTKTNEEKDFILAFK